MSSRWPVVVAFAALGVATQVSWLAYAATTTVAARHFGVSEEAVGWLANLFPLLFVVLAVPTGMALDRALRPTLAVGAVLIAAGAVLRVAQDAYWAALVGQALAAVAQPILANAITRVAAAYLRPEHRPLGIAVGAGATYLGMIIAIGVGTAIPTDVPAVVAVGGAISVAAAVAGLFALRGEPPWRPASEVSPLRVVRVPGVPVLAAIVFLGMGSSSRWRPGWSRCSRPRTSPPTRRGSCCWSCWLRGSQGVSSCHRSPPARLSSRVCCN
ncbi:MFS transporter [Actinokineospora terrae]|uniref:MFS transporter n=1 Tax=Actinokineospora terrae TaxID=155974 RepID=UPI000B826DD6|nr:MFS transporter [Actinokineospora terrae]